MKLHNTKLECNNIIWYHLVPLVSFGIIWDHLVSFGIIWYHFVPKLPALLTNIDGASESSRGGT
jgi:hypothetical protein